MIRLILFLLCLSIQPALAVNVQSPIDLPANAVDAGTKTVSGIIAAIGANARTVIVSQSLPAISGNATIPSTLELQFTGAGQLACGSSVLTIQSATGGWPDRQIFATDCGTTGSINFSGNGRVGAVKPVWWGCKGDNTDCSAAIQAAVLSLDTGPKSGTIHFLAGVFPFTNVAIPVTITALTIEGEGGASAYQKGTYLENTGTTPLFTTSGSGTMADLLFEKLQIRQTNSSRGHIFNPVNSITRLRLEKLYIQLANPASSVLEVTTGNPSLIEASDVTALQASGASVPLFNVVSGGAGLNVYGIHFKDSALYGSETSTAPIVKIDNQCGACTGYAAQFTNITLEIPGGGGIHLYSLQGSLLINVTAVDLVAAPSQPTILFKKSSASGALPSKDMTIINSTFLEGDATNPDVKVESLSAQAPLVIINSRMGFLDTSAFCVPIFIGSIAIPTLASGTAPLQITAGGRITGVNDLQFNKTNSPQTCAPATEGAHYYDQSLKLDCVCDGTNWCRVSAPATCTSNSSCG